jgi:HEAT repeat protein
LTIRTRRSAQAFFDELSASTLLDAVADAVQDRDRVVRLVAFSTLEEMYEFTPVWDVADLVVHDPDPQIRMRALELLTYGGRQAAIDQLVLALSDPNPQVSELAGALLSEFEQAPS